MKLISHFFLFALAGTLGFIVDTSILYLLKETLGLYLARGVSFLSAVIATWIFNRTITFRSSISAHSKRKEFLVYLFLMAIGGSINYCIYAFLITRHNFIATHPIVGVAAGSAAAMLANFTTSKIFLFREKHKE